MEEKNLNEGDIEKCIKLFNTVDNDETGLINYIQLQEILAKLEIFFEHENILFNILSENDINFNKITFHDFLNIYGKYKPSENNNIDSDTLDAFIAMGGSPDGEGNIEADKLIDVIKNQFQMEINIEELISQIDENNNGEIDIDELNVLLKNSDYNEKFIEFQNIFSKE